MQSKMPLHWEDMPIILVTSLLQAVVGGLVLGMVTGGLVGLLFDSFWVGTQIAAVPLGLLLFGASIVAGLLPETKKAPLLEMPKAD